MIALSDPPADTQTIAPVTGHWPADQYVTVRDVPTFAEHRTKTRDGRALRFGQRELQAVADRCNRRIAETGDYAVVVIGHTPDPQQKAAGNGTDPEVVGFAGPFHVDRIGGNGKSRYAILADYHYFHDPAVLEKVRKHPRRSPELWVEDSYTDMFLDPIALLGAEAPRLDMGLFYAAVRNGQQVEKYQAAVAACPSAGNSFIPGTDELGDKTKRYDAEQSGRPDSQPNTENPDMISEEEIRRIAEAIMQTDVMQWAKNKMESEMAGNTTVPPEGTMPVSPVAALDPVSPAPLATPPLAGPPSAELPPEPPPPALPASVDAPTPAGNLSPEVPAGGPSAGSEPPEIDPDTPDDEDEDVEEYRKWRRQRWATRRKKKKYSAAAVPDAAADDSTGELLEETEKSPSKYQKPALPERASVDAEVTELRARVEKYEKALESERATRTDADRYSKLLALRQQYAFDIDREFERCKYGRMSDQQFADFAGNGGIVETNFMQIPVGMTLPTFDKKADGIPAPGANGDPERYSREQSDRAYKYCEARRLEGKEVDYVEILQAVKDGKELPA